MPRAGTGEFLGAISLNEPYTRALLGPEAVLRPLGGVSDADLVAAKAVLDSLDVVMPMWAMEMAPFALGLPAHVLGPASITRSHSTASAGKTHPALIAELERRNRLDVQLYAHATQCTAHASAGRRRDWRPPPPPPSPAPQQRRRRAVRRRSSRRPAADFADALHSLSPLVPGAVSRSGGLGALTARWSTSRRRCARPRVPRAREGAAGAAWSTACCRWLPAPTISARATASTTGTWSACSPSHCCCRHQASRSHPGRPRMTLANGGRSSVPSPSRTGHERSHASPPTPTFPRGTRQWSLSGYSRAEVRSGRGWIRGVWPPVCRLLPPSPLSPTVSIRAPKVEAAPCSQLAAFRTAVAANLAQKVGVYRNIIAARRGSAA